MPKFPDRYKLNKEYQQKKNLPGVDIPGFPGYRITEQGDIWSYFGKTPIKRKQFLYPGRYVSISLMRAGKGVMAQVHTLVLLSFVGPPIPPNNQTRHLDGNRHNNKLSNLCWGTQTENEADKELHGTANRYGGAKINKQIADEIRRRVANGEVQRHLAKEYGIDPANVCVIIKGKIWR